VAAALDRVSDLLLFEGGEPHRARAFRRAAQAIRGTGTPILATLQTKKVFGVGEGTMERVREIIATGTCHDEQRLLQRFHPDQRGWLQLRGMSPRLVRDISATLRVNTTAELVMAARMGLLARVPSIGVTTRTQLEAQLLDPRGPQLTPMRMPLRRALAVGDEVIRHMRGLDDVFAIEQTGSARRRKPSVGDLDVVVATHDAARTVAHFCAMPGVDEVLLRGDGRAAVLLQEHAGQTGHRAQVDLRVAPVGSWGAALHMFTGSRQHNIDLRTYANQQRLTWSEHGVWERKLKSGSRGEDNRKIARCITPGPTEASMFAALGMSLIAPEMREGSGELVAARTGALPVLVDGDTLRVDGGRRVQSLAQLEDVGAWLRNHSSHCCALWLDGSDDVNARVATEAQRMNGVAGLVQTWSGRGPPPSLNGALNSSLVVWVRGAADEPPLNEVMAALEHPRVVGLRISTSMPATWWDLVCAQLARQKRALVLMPDDDDAVHPMSTQVRAAVERGVMLLLCSGAAHTADWAMRWNMVVWHARRSWAPSSCLWRFWPSLAQGADGAAIPMRADIHVDLASKPLSDATRARLEAFLQGHVDHELDEALRMLGPVPLQVAFVLLSDDPNDDR
jgi:DNA polymerase/3'-5' exonuclease PolX